ncbi:hypothetical protein ACSNOB_04175 [Micromonospora sp. URMC 106]|uniref:hypothetical protein n=1 Tax=Micromonospora sp. URMC 106 TaxID=3423408 RepID=UPI003F1C19C0
MPRIEPRALIPPPGLPDLVSRALPRPGPCTLDGRAGSGHAPVVPVEVTTDGGATRAPAILDEQVGGELAWRRWRREWAARPGWHVLGARATDASGRSQPVEQPWSRGGFADNLVQRVEVVALPG